MGGHLMSLKLGFQVSMTQRGGTAIWWEGQVSCGINEHSSTSEPTAIIANTRWEASEKHHSGPR